MEKSKVTDSEDVRSWEWNVCNFFALRVFTERVFQKYVKSIYSNLFVICPFINDKNICQKKKMILVLNELLSKIILTCSSKSSFYADLHYKSSNNFVQSEELGSSKIGKIGCILCYWCLKFFFSKLSLTHFNTKYLCLFIVGWSEGFKWWRELINI